MVVTPRLSLVTERGIANWLIADSVWPSAIDRSATEKAPPPSLSVIVAMNAVPTCYE